LKDLNGLSQNSLDERLALDEVVEVLIALRLVLLLLDGFVNNVAQLRPIEEGARVLQDVLWPVVEDFADEERDEASDLWVFPEVPLVFDSKLKLLAGVRGRGTLPFSSRSRFSKRE
jgi:hypothetical protein